MKTAAIPALNAGLPLREAEDEDEDEFIVRGLRSRDEARRTDEYIAVNEVMAKLRAMTAEAKKKKKVAAR